MNIPIVWYRHALLFWEDRKGDAVAVLRDLSKGISVMMQGIENPFNHLHVSVHLI